jgi:hypothetical protein
MLPVASRHRSARRLQNLSVLSEVLERRAYLAVTPGPEFRVNTFTANDQLFPATAMDAAGNSVIVWQSAGQDDPPSLTFGIYAQLYDAAGTPQGPEFRVNTTTAGAQTRPAVAMEPSGEFVVAWESTDVSSQAGIFAQRFNADGVKQGPEFPVNTHTENQQANPSVAIDVDGDFVIAWQSVGQDAPPTSGYGVYAQRFNAAGAPQGGEFRVNSFTTDNQFYPSVAMDYAGDFVIAWHSNHQGPGSTSQVYAQRYSAAGVALSGEFRVSTQFDNNQQFPSAAMDAAGDFVIAWASDGLEAAGALGVFAKRYTAAGVPVTGELHVNTQPGKNQRFPSVAMDADGDFVVVWQSEETSPPSGRVGLWGQRFTSGGAGVEGNFEVNVSTTGGQPFPAVAMDATGDFIAAWNTYGLDSTATVRRGGVYARLYSEPHAPRVTQVYTRGTTWTAPFLAYLPTQGLGSDPYGFALGVGANVLADLPWRNLNQVSIAFDRDVTVAQGNLTVHGVTVANYATTAFAYNPTTHVATWTLGQNIPNDKVLLTLSGAADFRYRFNVLPGNVNRSGSVLADDFSAVKSRFFKSTAAPGSGATAYTIFHDVDGNGSIVADDFSFVKSKFFSTLPGPEPAGVAPAAVLTDRRHDGFFN